MKSNKKIKRYSKKNKSRKNKTLRRSRKSRKLSKLKKAGGNNVYQNALEKEIQDEIELKTIKDDIQKANTQKELLEVLRKKYLLLEKNNIRINKQSLDKTDTNLEEILQDEDIKRFLDGCITKDNNEDFCNDLILSPLPAHITILPRPPALIPAPKVPRGKKRNYVISDETMKSVLRRKPPSVFDSITDDQLGGGFRRRRTNNRRNSNKQHHSL